MKINSPLFSIVIPTYNRANLIAKTIQSVFAQNFQDYEIIVIDDGSTDNTEDVVKSLSDSRLYYYRKINSERGAARNFGLQKSTGKYINYFDSDDLMYPNHLQVAADYILKNNSPEIFHLAYDFKTPADEVIKRVDNFNDTSKHSILFDNTLSCNGVFLRRDISLMYPFHEQRVLASAEDWELWIRLISRYSIGFDNTITSSVIAHEQRSIRTIAIDKMISRDLLLIDLLRSDSVILKNYGKSFSRFIAERYTYIMLGLAENKHRNNVFKWCIKAVRVYPRIILTKRFWASIKNMI